MSIIERFNRAEEPEKKNDTPVPYWKKILSLPETAIVVDQSNGKEHRVGDLVPIYTSYGVQNFGLKHTYVKQEQHGYFGEEVFAKFLVASPSSLPNPETRD